MKSTDPKGRKLIRYTKRYSLLTRIRCWIETKELLPSEYTYDEVLYPGDKDYDSEYARDYATCFDPAFYIGEYVWINIK